MSVGYSGRPLSAKLGLRPGGELVVLDAPADLDDFLDRPDGTELTSRAEPGAGLVLCFVTDRAVLADRLATLRPTIAPAGAVWVAWPKKASKVPTDVTEDVIREVALPMGLVDVKVCAVSAVWSGLKLVIRRELR